MKKFVILCLIIIAILFLLSSCFRSKTEETELTSTSFGEKVEENLLSNCSEEELIKIKNIIDILNECSKSKYNVIIISKKLGSIKTSNIDLSGIDAYSLTISDNIKLDLYGNPLFRAEITYNNRTIILDYMNQKVYNE